MEYNVIPKRFLENAEGKDAGDALVNFAASMDTDMNRYMTAVPEEETGDIIGDFIINLIRNAELSADACSGIFRALSCKNNVLGGKFWTSEDVRSYIEERTDDGVADNISDDVIEDISEYVDTDVLTEADDSEWNAIEDAIKESGASLHITDIDWDTEDEYDEELTDLPEEVDILISDIFGRKHRRCSERPIRIFCQWIHHRKEE